MACWPLSSRSRAVQIRRIRTSARSSGARDGRAAFGVDQHVGQRRQLGQRRGVAGVRQHHPAPDQPGQRAEPRQPLRRLRPGAPEIALVRRERPPEAVRPAPVEPLGQQRARAPTSAWPAAPPPRAASPARRRRRSGGSSPAPRPCASTRAGRLPSAARSSSQRQACRSASSRASGSGAAQIEPLPVATSRPSARQRAVEERLPALGVAEKDRLRQRRRPPRAARPAAPGAPRCGSASRAAAGRSARPGPSASERSGTWAAAAP